MRIITKIDGILVLGSILFTSLMVYTEYKIIGGIGLLGMLIFSFIKYEIEGKILRIK